MQQLTTINDLVDNRLLGTRIARSEALRLKLRTPGEVAPRVHGPLQRVPLPTEQVVGVVSVSCAIPLGPHERLAAVLGPL